MQIHIDAIEKSRTEDTQYVLRKSLYMVRISNKKDLLEYLKDGWDIVGKYHNGVRDEYYKITNQTELSCIKEFIERIHFIRNIKSVSTITVHFSEYFEPITCKTIELMGTVKLFGLVDGKLEHEIFCCREKYANKLKGLLLDLSIQQDKTSVINLLEKKMNMEEGSMNCDTR